MPPRQHLLASGFLFVQHSASAGARNSALPCEWSMMVRLTYLALVLVIFITEIAIAIGAIGGPVVRGSLGDLLVIALIYFLLRGITRLSPVQAAVLAVAVGFLAEILQYLRVAELLGLRKGSIMYTLIGNTFDPSDLLMYVVGGALSLVIDRYLLIPCLSARGRVSRPQMD